MTKRTPRGNNSRVLATAHASTDLRVCPSCGWYLSYGHEERCQPGRGRLADELVAQVPEAQATKLGYGDGVVVLGENIDDHDFYVCLDVQDRGFTWRAVTCFQHELSVDDAADLVKTLLAWRGRCRERSEERKALRRRELLATQGITREAFEALSPHARGYAVYMWGSNPEELHVPDERNPYPAGSAEAAAWDEGARRACLEVQDAEE